MSVLADAVVVELARLAKRAARAAEKRNAGDDPTPSSPPVDDAVDVLPSAAREEQDFDEDVAGAAAAGTADVISAETVDEILEKHGIPAYASKAIPVSLRVGRVHFAGVKRLPATHQLAVGYDLIVPDEDSAMDAADPAPRPDDVEADADAGVLTTANEADTGGDDEPAEGGVAENVPSVEIPFSWTWEPPAGVNGVGSNRNLRGKSTVLNVIMWALSGRCANFQVDNKKWIRHVEVDWLIGTETVRVEFDADNGHAVGTVAIVEGTERPRVLGRFDGEEEFEGIMGSVMMTRLRLAEIPMWTKDREVVHRWPAYASAFAVRAEQLDPVVGNVNVLGVRMLQMFIGTDWGPALAATQAAHNEMKAERSAAEAKAEAADQAVTEQRKKAQSAVDRLSAAMKAIDIGTPDAAKLHSATATATKLAHEVHVLERSVMEADSQLDTVRLQLRAAKARNHTQLEDALATRFFHQMRPTVCPRCTSTITPEQHAAETDRHECSLCSKGLELEEVDAATTSGTGVSTVAEDDAPVDEVHALEAAFAEAKDRIDALNDEIAAKKEGLASAEAQGVAAMRQVTVAGERRTLELDLARAEGALGALSGASGSFVDDSVDTTALEVLTAASTVLSKWVREQQDPLLKDISADIETLAVEFGADSLSNIKLGGGGRLDVTKGGEHTTYSTLTPGEKLRVKIATAVALIKHGYVAGIGRHPGFLVLDSPAAEEMPEEDLAVLIAALADVARQADMQIFVGTRTTGPLVDYLPEENRRLAIGDDYLW